MEKPVLLVGEPMGLLMAKEIAALEDVQNYEFAVAGAEYNVAIGLRRLGHSVSYLTRLGEDPFGRHIEKQLQKNGIDTSLLFFDAQRRTGFMLKGRTEQGDPPIAYFRAGSAAAAIGPQDIERLSISSYGWVHITGIFPALSESCREAVLLLAKKARSAGIPLSFDPNVRRQLWPNEQTMCECLRRLAGLCNLILPGQEEARLLTNELQPKKQAECFLQQGADCVIIKTGAEGAYYRTAHESGRVAGFAVSHVVDTVGAGDGFAVGVLSARLEGEDWPQAVRRGNAIGALQVMSRGDNEGLPTLSQLQAFLAQAEKQ